MSEDAINPNFKLSSFVKRQSLTENEIMLILKANYDIFRKIQSVGIIHSKDFAFIDKATFSETDKSCIEKKNSIEKNQALKNQKLVEDYFNKLHPRTLKPIKINFASRNDNECALYDINRYNSYKIQEKLEEIFGY